MFPWRPITIRRRPPEGVLTIQECRDRRLAEAHRKFLQRYARTGRKPIDFGNVLHFQMIDANLRRLLRYKDTPLRRGCGRLRGWTDYLIHQHPDELLR